MPAKDHNIAAGLDRVNVGIGISDAEHRLIFCNRPSSPSPAGFLFERSDKTLDLDDAGPSGVPALDDPAANGLSVYRSMALDHWRRR